MCWLYLYLHIPSNLNRHPITPDLSSKLSQPVVRNPNSTSPATRTDSGSAGIGFGIEMMERYQSVRHGICALLWIYYLSGCHISTFQLQNLVSIDVLKYGNFEVIEGWKGLWTSSGNYFHMRLRHPALLNPPRANHIQLELITVTARSAVEWCLNSFKCSAHVVGWCDVFVSLNRVHTSILWTQGRI
jgi:hypothetical protein